MRGILNEAVVTFVLTVEDDEAGRYPITRVTRIEFEGTPEEFLSCLNIGNLNFRVVAMEALTGVE